MLATAGYILASLTLSYSGESEVLHMPASLNNRLVEQPSVTWHGWSYWVQVLGYLSRFSFYFQCRHGGEIFCHVDLPAVCYRINQDTLLTHLKTYSDLNYFSHNGHNVYLLLPYEPQMSIYCVLSLSLFLYIWSEHTEEA